MSIAPSTPDDNYIDSCDNFKIMFKITEKQTQNIGNMKPWGAVNSDGTTPG